MNKLLLFLVFSSCCSLSSLLAQPLLQPAPDSISGIWVGTLYQQEGGIADEFFMMLEIDQSGYYCEGTSRVGVENIQAAITFVATLQPEGHWAFTEKKIVNARAPENLEWCYKQYHLTLKYASDGTMILTGPWWGHSKSGRCIPGTIILKRSKARA